MYMKKKNNTFWLNLQQLYKSCYVFRDILGIMFSCWMRYVTGIIIGHGCVGSSFITLCSIPI